jgi:hypothetical protein
MAWTDYTTPADAVLLETMGEPITYRVGGSGEPIETSAILDASGRAESSAPGYFGEIEVDPAVVTDPQMGDLVIWADGVEYLVQRVVRPAYGLTRLQLRRKADPAEMEIG